jgi:FtsP/CotA-like multicopper oxidase with cupredoxin domain
MQMEKGLYGNILVESDKSPLQVDYEIPLILDDVSIIDGTLEKFDSDKVTKTLMGRFGNTMLINGNSDYSLEVKQGDVSRFYLTNTANTRTFDFGIEQHQMKLIGDDASYYEKETFSDSVIIASSERRTVDVLFDNAGEFNIIHNTPEKTYVIGRVIVSPSAIEESNSDFYKTAKNLAVIQEIDPFRKFFSEDPDLELEFDLKTTTTAMQSDHLEISDDDNATIMDKHEARLDPIEWEDEMPEMNAMSNDENTNWILRDVKSGKEGFDIGYQASVGDVKKIRLINSPDSAHPMQHPIHLHGQRFLVLNEDGIPNENLAWKDSVLVPTGSTVDILVEFSNPGQWAMHCHILEHAEAGMITEVTVNP